MNNSAGSTFIRPVGKLFSHFNDRHSCFMGRVVLGTRDHIAFFIKRPICNQEAVMGFQNLSNCPDLSKYAKSAGKRETRSGYYIIK